jgi:hypothetical protein
MEVAAPLNDLQLMAVVAAMKSNEENVTMAVDHAEKILLEVVSRQRQHINNHSVMAGEDCYYCKLNKLAASGAPRITPAKLITPS